MQRRRRTKYASCLQGRCAAVVFCNNQLALLPGTGMDSLDAMMDASSFTSPAALGTSYVVSLPKMGIREVRLWISMPHEAALLDILLAA